MTQDRLTAPALEAAQVAAYLREHPDFFVDQDELLQELRIPHAPRGAISLVERQLYSFRHRNEHLHERLGSMLETARDNDRLFEKTRRLILALMDADSLEEVIGAVDESLRHDFNVPYTSLILFSQHALPVGRSVPAEQALSAIGGLLLERQGICGVLRPNDLAFLFEDDSPHIGSAAVIAVGGRAVLAIGTPDPQHYKGSLGTLFLAHIAEVLERVLARFSTQLECIG